MSFIRLVLTVTTLSVISLGASSAASAVPDGGPPCTLGEAKANFEAPFEHFVQDALAVRFRCQYRVFFDGRTFTYCEGDVILGGTNNFVDYEALGWSREEGIAELERTGIRVWIDGIEQQLMQTAYKDGQHPVFGRVVYQQHGLITQLPVGDHVSYYEETFDGTRVESATVQLRILPLTDPACS